MNTQSLHKLWNHTQKHPGTSGARAAAAVLLGLYNGSRFPLDLSELRVLDHELRCAAIDVIASDAEHLQMEVHEWLNKATGRRDFGARFEHLAWQYDISKPGRCERDELVALESKNFRVEPHRWVKSDHKGFGYLS